MRNLGGDSDRRTVVPTLMPKKTGTRPASETATAPGVISPIVARPTATPKLDTVKKMLAAWTKRSGSRWRDIKNGSTGITCEPVRPLTMPFVKPIGADSGRTRRVARRKSGRASAKVQVDDQYRTEHGGRVAGVERRQQAQTDDQSRQGRGIEEPELSQAAAEVASTVHHDQVADYRWDD